ncbi:MAG: hypothetical protein AB1813_10170 [Verrucomicrobiota bacterium]
MKKPMMAKGTAKLIAKEHPPLRSYLISYGPKWKTQQAICNYVQLWSHVFEGADHPGMKFLTGLAKSAKDQADPFAVEKLADALLTQLGRAIRSGNPKFFRDLADTIEQHHHAKKGRGTVHMMVSNICFDYTTNKQDFFPSIGQLRAEIIRRFGGSEKVRDYVQSMMDDIEDPYLRQICDECGVKLTPSSPGPKRIRK